MKQRKSEINETFIVKENQWVISLARKANSIVAQHAFLILETIENEKSGIYFIDLVGDGMLKLGNFNVGRVRMKHVPDDKTQAQQEGLIFSCSYRMMDLKPGDKLASKQWYINQDKALDLISSVNEEMPPKTHPFSILGKQSVLTGSSADASDKERGHSCFSWAKEKLKSVGIEVKGNDVAEWFEKYAAVTSLTTDSSITTLGGSVATTAKHWATFFNSPRNVVLTALGIGAAASAVYYGMNKSS